MVSKWSSLSKVSTNVFVRRKRNSNTRIFKLKKILFIKNVSAKSLQSCPALCDPMECSPPGSSVWDSPGKDTGVGCHAFSRGSS